MKRYLYRIISALIFMVAVVGCKKEEPLDVDFSKYNVDNPVANSALDTWLNATFLDEYNIETVYRYNRFYHGDDKDVAAVKIETVRPQMETVLEGFLLPYRTVAGAPFIKRMAPKQFVLFGSGAYNTDHSYLLGTAEAGRRITLYDLNNFDVNDGAQVVGKLRTIHHEFTHILNQIVPMPVDFVLISKGNYKATWTTMSTETAHDLGFVTPYASSQAGEDFAETVSHLLVYGQAWYDAWANESSETGRVALKAKEASIVNYFTINLGINFRALQQEIQKVVINEYKYEQASFPFWIQYGHFKTVTVNPESSVSATYGTSAAFTTPYNQFKAAVLAFSASQKFHLDKLDFGFDSDEDLLIVRAYFSNSNTQYIGDYNFSYTLDSSTGEMTFTKTDQGTEGAQYSNAGLFLDSFSKTIQPYLTTHTFIADYLPAKINAENYNSYGGFYVKGDPENYFYGQLGQSF
jgi:substrate import-associated zinc metallohydrolase lipoprotein